MSLAGCRAKDRSRYVAGLGIVSYLLLLPFPPLIVDPFPPPPVIVFLCWSLTVECRGVECLITTYIPTIKGGATNEHSLRKSLRIMEIAEQNRLPLISFIETVLSSPLTPPYLLISSDSFLSPSLPSLLSSLPFSPVLMAFISVGGC